MLNVVAGPEESPAAVLIRAIHPNLGVEIIAARRPKARSSDWSNGPARLCQALDIDGRLTGVNFTDPQASLVIVPGRIVEPKNVRQGPRVGIDAVPEPWKSMPWRYRVMKY
jgi:DNA-3-methyladenine glycosylase